MREYDADADAEGAVKGKVKTLDHGAFNQLSRVLQQPPGTMPKAKPPTSESDRVIAGGAGGARGACGACVRVTCVARVATVRVRLQQPPDHASNGAARARARQAG
eukprot:735089-Prymnesium_polylepis.1